MAELAIQVGGRLKELRKRANLNQSKLGALAGVSASQISRLESGAQWGHEDTFSALFQALAQALDQTPTEVQALVLAPAPPGGRAEASGLPEGYVLVPFFDLEQAAAKGGQGQLEPQTYVGLSRAWLSGGRSMPPEDMLLARVVGDSMEPTLRQGDVVLADRSKAGVPDDALYLLRMADTLLIRRLQRLPGGRVRVACDNKAYGSFEMEPGGGDEDTVVIGRVVRVSKEI